MPESSDISKTAIKYANAASTSPVPAWALSAALVYRGLSLQKPVDPKLGSGGSFDFSKSVAASKPSRLSCFLFGGVSALGGYIIHDGDVPNGAGFTFAWSTLYLIVNGRPAFKSLQFLH
ncbi:hypothetical protein CXQ85_002563 [Candidozyma haemuli]|uniref:Uncharacterized protein n=1 Tax=Candidozyma haemuli TaxID=45357 RepID=A0A2V1AYK8_9ASCO|nr:hypothetical protein CXQ85_002563 [[Candida] haemuloni]PVH22839.1 hypothetical protein CXQ85_002563 [[Candida] haemuloni]